METGNLFFQRLCERFSDICWMYFILDKEVYRKVQADFDLAGSLKIQKYGIMQLRVSVGTVPLR